MATQYSNKPIVTDGLVYALDFGNPKSYVSGSDTAQSLKYDLTTSVLSSFGGVPTPNLQNGLLKILAPTSNTGNYIVVPKQFSEINPLGEFTIQTVVSPESTLFMTQGPSSARLISNIKGGTKTGMFGWYITPVPYGGGTEYKNISSAINSGLQHLTYRYSSGSYTLFVNGVPSHVLSRGEVVSTNSSDFRINGRTNGTNLATQDLGNLYIYNRALTSDEIYSNYLIQAQRYGLPTTPKPYSIDENAYLFLSQSGITDPIITSSIDTFVRGLKTNNLWDKMIAIYPFVGTGSAGINLTGSHSWNLKDPTTAYYKLGFTGSWIGSTSGSAPSGSGTAINTGVLPYEYYPFKSDSNQHLSILSYDTPVSSSILAGTGMTKELAVSTLAGDYGTPAAAYSVRKVRTAYSGALMDVRRSLDNVTSSIGYVSNGDLDTGSLLDWVIPGRNTLPGTYSGLAAAYSLRRVSSSYSGSAIQANNGLVYRDIGFDASGNLNTGSLTSLVATGSNVLSGNYIGLAAAYSLRRVTSSYSGFAIEVRSGSASQSIGFDSTGNLDTGSLLSFIGSGDGFIKTWYDQSGNGYHASQLVNSRQPQIASSGVIITENSKPALSFDGTDDFLTASFAYNTDTLGVQKVERWKNLNSGQISTTFSQQFGPYLQWIQSNQTFSNYYRSAQTTSPATTTRKLYSFYTSLGFYENGTLTVARTTTTSSIQNSVVIGAFAESSLPASVNIQELIIYTSSQSDNRTYIENNINAYYDIYTTSSTSTENAFVNTWYDQSGNGRHATQTATGSQPLIVSSGSLVTENGKPALSFDGVDDDFIFAGLHGHSTLDQYFVASPNDTQYIYPASTNNGDFDVGYIVSSNNSSTSLYASYGSPSLYANGTLFTGTTRGDLYNFLTGSKVVVHQNASTAVWEGYTFNNYPSWDYKGTLQELIAYTSSQAANRPLIENNINNYYNIYTGSNHGFVARWYDQSGNNRHASQTATGSQPLIVESGSIIFENNRPIIRAIGGSQLQTSYNPANTRLEFAFVGKATPIANLIGNNNTDTYAFFAAGGGSSAFGSYTLNSGRYNGTANTYANRTTVSTLLSTQSVLYADGTFGSSFNRFDFGYQNKNYPMYSMQELIAYPYSSATSVQAIEYGINNYYNIYPQTSSFTTSSFAIYATTSSISASLNNDLVSGISSTGPLGLITVSRTGSNSLTIARNGVTSSFAVPASGALSTGIYLGAINNNGIALGNSPYNISFASVGTGLTGAEMGTLSILAHTLRYSLRGLDPDTVNFLASAVLTNETQIQAVNNLVLNLKANNLWDKMTAIYPFVGASSDAHKYNLKDPRNFTILFEGGWNHTNTGAATNGINTRGNTQISPSAHLVQDDTHISIYARSSLGNRPSVNVDIGGRPGSFFTVATWYAANFVLSDIYSNSNRITVSYPGGSTNLNGLGYFIFQRTSPTSHTVYKNATLLGTNSTNTGGTLPSAQMWIGANGQISEWSDREYSFISFGRGFTPTEVSTLTNIIQTYQTALSRQI